MMLGEWRKSSFSPNGGNCVELAYAGAVRDSKNPDGARLSASMPALIGAAKAGLLDR